MDERFLDHRLRSTSLAGIVGGIILGAMILWDLHRTGEVRYDLFAVLGVMAVVKLGAMLYFRLTR